MKKRLIAAVFLVVTMAVPAYAGVTVGITLPPPPEIVIEAAPRFIFSPELGFHVSVGVPYDIVYIGDQYYLYNNGYYYRSRYYNGPWVGVESRRLPPGLRRHKYQEIRRFRDVEYRRYEGNREHYRGRWHNPAERQREGVRPGEGRHGGDRPGEGRRDEGRHGEGGHGEGRHEEHRDSGERR